jgi:acyl-CoA thioesterase-1
MIFSLLFICLGLAATAARAETVLIFGDSLSSAYGMPAPRGWVALLEQRLKRERPDYSVANASISGETSAGGVVRIGAALERSKPAIVILELGANDGLRGLPVAEMARNLSSIIEQSQKAGARVLLVGMRLPPNYGDAYTRSFAQAYAELAKRHRTALLPFLLESVAERSELFQADRIHPTEAAQPVVLKNVWTKLDPLLRQKTAAQAPPRAAR